MPTRNLFLIGCGILIAVPGCNIILDLDEVRDDTKANGGNGDAAGSTAMSSGASGGTMLSSHASDLGGIAGHASGGVAIGGRAGIGGEALQSGGTTVRLSELGVGGSAGIAGSSNWATSCIIDSSAYPSGALRLDNSCQACQPALSTSIWTPVADGSSCASGKVCQSGACRDGCWIDSKYYPPGASNPQSPCESTCQPLLSSGSWSKSARLSCALGPNDCNGESCCTSRYVQGGSYVRADASSTATVNSFCMDEYEVTVGRFWNFLDAYDAWIAGKNPAPGAGEHLVGAGSGWQTDWTSSLPLSSAVFQDSKHLECDASMLTLIGGERNRPINCVSWYEAFAFCIWDGGRLATDAEWEYAARNGSKLTAYPWGNTPEPNNKLAVYVCQGDGDPSGCSINDIAPVGSVQQGNNSYGQADLAGNVWEWVTDAFSNYPSTCDNCVISSGLGRVYRGGGYDNRSNYLGSRTYIEPTRRTLDLGIRCVRSVQ